MAADKHLVSRRALLGASVVGVAAWTTPQIRTVARAATPGSQPTSTTTAPTTTTTAPPTTDTTPTSSTTVPGVRPRDEVLGEVFDAAGRTPAADSDGTDVAAEAIVRFPRFVG